MGKSGIGEFSVKYDEFESGNRRDISVEDINWNYPARGGS